jgi:PAS domain S-box-containing protein
MQPTPPSHLHALARRLPTPAIFHWKGTLLLNAAAERLLDCPNSAVRDCAGWFKRVFGEQSTQAEEAVARARTSGFARPEILAARVGDRWLKLEFSACAVGEQAEMWLLKDLTAQSTAEERFRTLFEKSADATLFFDETGILDCNDAALKMLRCPSKDALRAAHPATFSPERQPDGSLSLEKSRRMDGIARSQGYHQFEWIHRRFDGSEFPVEVTLNPVQLEGRTVLLVGWRDLTQSKNLEENLRKYAEALDHAQSMAGIASFEMNLADGRFIWSRQAAKIFGFKDREEMLPGSVSTRIHPDDLPEAVRCWRTCIERKNRFVCEYRVVHPDGSQLLVLGTGEAVLDAQGNCVGLRGTVQDVTAIRQAERRAREQQAMLVHASKLSSLGEMAAGIAHEINNPLLVIQLAAEQLKGMLAAETESSAAAGKLCDRIAATTDRIGKIVHGLRNFSGDDTRDPPVRVATSKIIEETLSLCVQRFQSHGVKLEVKLPEEIVLIRCRPVQISQVILNLLNNAFDAVVKQPHPLIRLEVRESRGLVELSVTDNGPGIPFHLRDRIMEPFFSTKGVGKGTGLGLSIASGIVKAHGGTLELDSSQGTRFVARLPQEAANRQAA